MRNLAKNLQRGNFLTIPTRSGLQYQPSENQEDQRVEPPDIEEIRITEGLHFLGNEIPRITEQAYVRICEEAENIARGIEQGDHRTAVAHYYEILNCVRRTEELIDGILDASRLLSQLVPDTRQHE